MKSILALTLLSIALSPGIAPAANVGRDSVDVPAAWLPQIPDGYAPWRQHEALVSNHAAAAVGYDPTRERNVRLRGRTARSRGEGPSRVRLRARDRVLCRRLLFVAGSGRRVRTARGIALGASLADVRRAYGQTALHAVPGHAAMRMLSYAAMYAHPNSCGQFQNFMFRDRRLVPIELLDGY